MSENDKTRLSTVEMKGSNMTKQEIRLSFGVIISVMLSACGVDGVGDPVRPNDPPPMSRSATTRSRAAAAAAQHGPQAVVEQGAVEAPTEQPDNQRDPQPSAPTEGTNLTATCSVGQCVRCCFEAVDCRDPRAPVSCLLVLARCRQACNAHPDCSICD